jgi:hypothetical protein
MHEGNDAPAVTGTAIALASRRLLIRNPVLVLAKDPQLLRALAQFTCRRCKCVLRNRVRYLLHFLQCRGATDDHRARAVWVLATDLSFIKTLWPKGTRLAGLLAGKGPAMARQAGYAHVTQWLWGTVYRGAFQATIQDIRIPRTHRRREKWLCDAAGRQARVAPIDLPPEWFAWWCTKEVRRRASLVLCDLLGVGARARFAGSGLPVEEAPDPQSTAEAIRSRAAADRIAAARRNLCQLCAPEASGPFSFRERQHLLLALDGCSTAEIKAALQIPTDQAVFAAMSRLRQKLPQELRAVLSPRRRSATPI